MAVIEAVYINRDYEPAAVARDGAVESVLRKRGVSVLACKDQVIFEKNEVLTQGGRLFTVFGPNKNTWLKKLGPFFM
jgi:deoxyribodipyrimidine photo-lyase